LAINQAQKAKARQKIAESISGNQQAEQKLVHIVGAQYFARFKITVYFSPLPAKYCEHTN